jgi:hypothetical protein
LTRGGLYDAAMKSRGERLRWARRQAGFKTARAACEQFGWSEGTYRSHERGVRDFKYETAVIYGRKFKVNPKWLMDGKGDIKPQIGPPTDIADLKPIDVLGELAAGRWLEVHAAQDKISNIVVPADPRYPIEAQYALIVRGTSLNRLAQDGEVVVCVDIERAGIQVLDDDPVVIEQTRHGLYEVTGKRVRKKGNTVDLDARQRRPEIHRSEKPRLSTSPLNRPESEISGRRAPDQDQGADRRRLAALRPRPQQADLMLR